ncbi:MAG: pentapeptide repeat-containing protein [Acetobacteraceae bacterium]|nr:pentapeptide repeat-containing protein [Acetobacteraceae bacterium]
MPNDEHIALLQRGAAAWNAWWAERAEVPDLSRAGLRGLDLSGFDLSRADLRGADLRSTNLSAANLSAAHLEGANVFKAVLDGADLAGAFLNGAQFLNCAQLVVARNWASAFRDDALACGEAIPGNKRSKSCA